MPYPFKYAIVLWPFPNLLIRHCQLSFAFFVYPALVLAYLGQGARLIVDGENIVTNIFYKSIPGPPNGALYWYGDHIFWHVAFSSRSRRIFYVVAILATVRSLFSVSSEFPTQNSLRSLLRKP